MEENDLEKGIGDILRTSMAELEESNANIHERVVGLADEGFFEQHQTTGSLKALADELLSISVEGGQDSESE